MTAFGGTLGQPSKKATELGPVTFDFTSVLAVGELINGQSVTAAVYTGVDANPSGILSGAATLNGKLVSQKITTAVTGVVYSLNCVVTTTSGNTYQQSSYFAITPVLT